MQGLISFGDNCCCLFISSVSFTWDEYLKGKDANPAPQACFKQVGQSDKTVRVNS